MKTLHTLLFSLIAFTPIYAANELAWVDEQIEAIKPPRIGLSSDEIVKLKNPFIFLRTQEKKEKVSKNTKTTPVKSYKKRWRSTKRYKGLTLEAVLNKSVLINGKWYKLGEKVYGYTITKINAKTVELRKYKRTKILSTKSKKSNIKLSK